MADLDQDQQEPLEQPTPQTKQPVPKSTASQEVVTSLLPSDLKKEVRFFRQITDSMLSSSVKGIMIGGDTGLGKTSFIKQLGRVLGLPVVIIEVPHVTEEELINIPFIVVQPNGQTSKGVETIKPDGGDGKVVDRTQFGLKLSKSHVVSTLEKLQKNPPPTEQTLKPHEAAILNQLTSTSAGRQEINQIRNQYDRILFLDEFFRQTNPTIVNILRNILNGQIGNDEIPSGTYTAYASNLKDTGGALAKQTSHTTFDQYDFPAPTVNSWLNFMISNTSNQQMKFKKDVVDAFASSMQDNDLDFRDMESNVRSSPRRWSEVLLYINNAYPFTSADQVSILKTSILRQFKNEEGKISPVSNVVEDIINKLIQKSGIDMKKIKPVPADKWRDVLAQNVLTKIATGENKKYVPVVQGPPGVGKTALATIFEKEPYNLRFIPVLASTLSADSISGIPLADTSKDEIETSFAKPELANLIDTKIEKARQSYMARLKRANPQTAEQEFEAWDNQPYKYLIFFDEINRVKNVGVFNALRRVILEKSFNDNDKLPEGSLVVAAMNPSDIGGTTVPLTEHFKDAIEIIDAETSWNDWVNHAEKFILPDIKNLPYNPSDIAIKTGWTIISRWPDAFTEKKRGQRSNYQFHVNVGEGDEIYMSPRDYDNLLRQVVKGIDREFNDLVERMNDGETLSDQQINMALVDAAYDKIQATLKNKFHQAQMQEPPGFMDLVYDFLMSNVNVSLKKETKQAGLGSILDQAMNDELPLSENPDFFNYINSLSGPAQLQDDVGRYLDNLTSSFMDENGINIEEAAPVLMSKGPGSVYHLFDNLATAIKENFDTGLLDFIEDAIFDTYTMANRAIAESMDQKEAEDYIIELIDTFDAIRALK